MSAELRARRRFEARLGRLLIGVTYLAVGLLLAGVGLMLVTGVSPLAGGPLLDPARLAADLVSFAPAGLLWLGLLAVIATPISRVIGAAAGFAIGGERVMAGVALVILLVIVLGVVVGLATG